MRLKAWLWAALAVSIAAAIAIPVFAEPSHTSKFAHLTTATTSSHHAI